MKLYYSKASPFARKVLINSIESGVRDQIEIYDTLKTGTLVLPDHFERINPLFKIPALEITASEAIVDSPVICEYIDSIAIKRKLLPQTSQERFTQHKYQSLADGIMDAAILRRFEFLRETHLKSLAFDQRQKIKITASLKFFDSQVSFLNNPYLIGEVSLMCALGYLDFRFPNENWRIDCSRLAEWYERAQKWPPFIATIP